MKKRSKILVGLFIAYLSFTFFLRLSGVVYISKYDGDFSYGGLYIKTVFNNGVGIESPLISNLITTGTFPLVFSEVFLGVHELIKINVK